MFKSIFDDSCNKKTLFIFPTHTNRIAGQNYYQGIATKFENEFTVISELMEQVFWVDKPILKEENRTISLFLSLSNDSKDFFKINDYAQSIAFSNNFFSFFKELNDELVEESQIVQLLQENYAHLDWKLLNFEHLLKVKNDFEIYLKKKKTTDEIFVKRIENLDTNFLKRFEQIVVVNQFY
ncbi:MAG: hypothetical protein U9N34_03425, partial [Candidatus Cloacimonadota bacterium]|nr:hypothetical protein [Candidatus Cloacimonadota bacterium]